MGHGDHALHDAMYCASLPWWRLPFGPGSNRLTVWNALYANGAVPDWWPWRIGFLPWLRFYVMRCTTRVQRLAEYRPGNAIPIRCNVQARNNLLGKMAQNASRKILYRCLAANQVYGAALQGNNRLERCWTRIGLARRRLCKLGVVTLMWQLPIRQDLVKQWLRDRLSQLVVWCKSNNRSDIVFRPTIISSIG